MKVLKTFSSLMLILLLSVTLFHSAYGENRYTLSVVLTGHVMLGIQYEYFFNPDQNVHLGLYPLLFPGKGYPFALKMGFNQYADSKKFRPEIGLDFILLVSPPDPDRRKLMPMLTLTPGFIYNSGSGHPISASLWVSYFLKHANRKIAPTGLEFKYGF